MATCGNCGQRGQTTQQIKDCYAASGTPVDKRSRKTASTTAASKKQPARKRRGTSQTATSRSAPKKTKKRGVSRGQGMARGQTGAEAQPSPGRMSAEEARKRYPSGATKQPADPSPKPKRAPRTGNRNRGGANFRDGLVNPPPTGGIAHSDY